MRDSLLGGSPLSGVEMEQRLDETHRLRREWLRPRVLTERGLLPPPPRLAEEAEERKIRALVALLVAEWVLEREHLKEDDTAREEVHRQRGARVGPGSLAEAILELGGQEEIRHLWGRVPGWEGWREGWW